MSEKNDSAKQVLLKALASMSGMAQIEQVILSKLDSDVSILREIPTYLLNLGGKRMRPLMSVLVWKAFSNYAPSQRLIDTAAGIELIHMATLLHDDIIDNAPKRRAQDSALIKFGPSPTLLAGDLLLVRAFALCAKLDSFIVDCTERACIELTEGEMMEMDRNISEYSINDSLEIARRKTAALFRLASQTAAYLADASKQQVQNMCIFGEKLGMAFQVLDDILDVTSSEDLLGKPSGTDIRECKPSCVNILWLKSSDPIARSALIERKIRDDILIEEAITAVKCSGAVEMAKDIAKALAKEARESLEASAPKKDLKAPGWQELDTLLTYTLERLY